ncbi:MAG: histidine--tRNA ligase, partial [Campylobacteraceae bacterium]|nr:histidine--tRNA ligase [Campylobacteraceae bacterium]
KVSQKRETTKVITDYKVRGFGKHLNNAQKKNATIVALIGENELKDNTVWIKNLETKEEQTISLGDF